MQLLKAQWGGVCRNTRCGILCVLNGSCSCMHRINGSRNKGISVETGHWFVAQLRALRFWNLLGLV